MEIGIDSFGAVISDPAAGLTLSPLQRTQNLVEEITLADKVGLDVFGVGKQSSQLKAQVFLHDKSRRQGPLS